ncbi:acyltransferase family protein [Cerasicoccus frondis]|uniref:acyltransferase family protein n=1 Tax=Cerasicoccus frondis TaxID=490090 RepID=UPI0028527854|nr:acyltransferase family protein [Cerasicoccus frondis]
MLIIYASSPQMGVAGKFLSLSPIVFIGEISYSLYLWHWPLIVISKTVDDFNPLMIFALSLVLATISYLLIEQRNRFLANRPFAVTAGVMASVMCISLILPFTLKRDGRPCEIPVIAYNLDLSPQIYESVMFEGHYGDYLQGLLLNDIDDGERLDVLLLGDSHAMMNFPAIRAATQAEDLTFAYYGALGATSPFLVEPDSNPSTYYFSGWTPTQRLEFDEARIAFVEIYQPRVIFLGGRWEAELYRHQEKGFKRHLDALFAVLKDSNVIIVGQPPILPFGDAGFHDTSFDLPLWRRTDEHKWSKETRKRVNQMLADFASANSNCYFVSLEEYHERDGGLHFIEGEQLLYTDEDHLSQFGSMKHQADFQKMLRDCLHGTQ